MYKIQDGWQKRGIKQRKSFVDQVKGVNTVQENELYSAMEGKLGEQVIFEAQDALQDAQEQETSQGHQDQEVHQEMLLHVQNETFQLESQPRTARKRALRQDGWTEEDDRLLAEITLRNIREGSTQTKAFEEAGERLNRTAGACAFRWATVVKHQYRAAVEAAKRQAREMKKKRLQRRQINLEQISVVLEGDTEVDLDTVIRTIKVFKQKERNYRTLLREYNRLEEENKLLRKENERLRKEIQEMNQRNLQQEEDYKTLLQIVNRARKMSLLDDNKEGNDYASVSNV